MADITGTSGNDTLVGTAADENIYGLEGNDTLDGNGGADRLVGGVGDDTYFVDADDIVVEAAGEGYDYVVARTSYVLAAGASVELMSTDNHAGTAAINLTGNELANILIGNAGANILNGGSGGADILQGLGGNDTYFVDADDIVIEAAGGGYDYVVARTSYVLAAGASVELMSTDNHGGTAAINLTGNELANILIGNAGANILNGGSGGADTLQGLGGDDTYFVDADDIVIEAAGGGYDYVVARTSYVLSAGASVELMSTDNHGGTAAINLTGNEFANVIIGNAGANILNGGSGGADTLQGLGGDDTYFVDADDTVIEAVGGGYDYVVARTSYVLSAGASVELMSTDNHGGTAAINLTGNEFANVIIGNAGANILNGGSGGADTLQGLGGDDTYFVDADDTVIEAAGQGYDYVVARTSYALAAGVSVELMSTDNNGGTAAINLTGNELANILVGNAGANVLNGGLGADILQGLGGNDTFAFTTALGNGNIDQILDFQTGSDKILLAGANGEPFAALAAGGLRVGTLVIGTAAVDADDYLIYNSATGALLYDADGNGAGAAVQFATLATGLNLTVTDFLVSGLANNAPAITSGATASVAENSAPSTIVYQTVANDADGDRITYSLSGTDAGLLSIDANGAVRLLASADFETKNSYVFNVIASDSGVATVKAVTLTITDVNDSVSTPVINETAAANDTYQAAQSIDPGALVIATNPNLYNAAYPSISIQGSISTPNDVGNISSDVDFYSITLQAGQQLILDIDGTNGLDSFLTLYGPNGVFIGSNDDQDDFDPGSNPPFGHNTDSQIIYRVATSGTYYFSVKSFADADTNQPTSKGVYTLNVSINSAPATAAQLQAEDIQALVGGSSWNHNGPAFNLTYGFPSLASYYPSNFAEVSQGNTFAAFSAQQQTATRALLQLVANVTQITFTENTTQGAYNVAGTAANANLRYARSSEVDPGAAYAYLPTNGGPSSLGGSAWFNMNSQNANFSNPQKGNYAWMGILHETGHALGLKHGHEFPLAISGDHDSIEYSVMTYRSYPGKDLSDGRGYTNETWGYAQTLMMLDIAALQKIYGSANYAFNSGDSTYTWSATTGEMSINGVGQGAPGANRILMTVWDGGGNDTYDLSNYAGGVTVDLRPGEWTTTNPTQIANLGDGHFARGNIANALLFEGSTLSAIENAKGGAGADTLIANQVANQLTGGGGADTFKWMAAGDAGTGQSADTVLDFVRNVDKIDFTNLDANPATAAHDAFTFIDQSAFHNVAGEVRWALVGGSAHIFADVDGNGTPDMEIILTNITTLAATDFNF